MQSYQNGQASKHPPKSFLETKRLPAPKPTNKRKGLSGVFGGITLLIDAGSNTRDLRKTARLNGGTIVLSFSDEVDFVITESTRSDLVRLAKSIGTCCLTPEWIDDCVACNSLVNVSSYIIQSEFCGSSFGLRLAENKEKRLQEESNHNPSKNHSDQKITKNDSLVNLTHRSPKKPTCSRKSLSCQMLITQSNPNSKYKPKAPLEIKDATKSVTDSKATKTSPPNQSTANPNTQDNQRQEKIQELIADLKEMTNEGFLLDNALKIEDINFDEISNGLLNTQTTFPKMLKKKEAPEFTNPFTLLQKIVVPKRRFTLDKVDESDPLKYLKYVQKKIKGALRS
jgi:hypothetical protein